MVKFLVKYYKGIVHLLIWSLFLIINVISFSAFKGPLPALQRGLLVILVYLWIFYGNWFILFPKFYNRKKHLLFLLSALVMLVVLTSIRLEIEEFFNFFPGVRQKALIENRAARHFLISFSMSTFIFMLSFVFRLTEYNTIQTRQKDKLLQQKTEAELKWLKAQINPHFLFNALNNIYALVLTHSDKAAGSLMSLSQLLRYIIYDASAEKVPLEKELTYLNYYIELESLRLSDAGNLKCDVSIDPGSFKITPLIFIPLVENSFKHSNINKGGFININMQLNDNLLIFTCENSFNESVKSIDGTGGVGLSNSKKRLEIAYPEKHILAISEHENVFRTKLSISL